jgi:hypothetical protein
MNDTANKESGKQYAAIAAYLKEMETRAGTR